MSAPVRVFHDRARRRRVDPDYPVTVSCPDPLSPGRHIFLNVEDLSESGLRALTSLDNAHVFPGMILSECALNVPLQGVFTVDLHVANVHLVRKGERLSIGFALSDAHEGVKEALRNYISNIDARTDAPTSEHPGPTLETFPVPPRSAPPRVVPLSHPPQTGRAGQAGQAGQAAPDSQAPWNSQPLSERPSERGVGEGADARARDTAQHFHASIMLTYVQEADARLGQDRVDALLKRLGMRRRYLVSSSNWVSLEFFDRFMEAVEPFVDLDALQFGAGRRTFDRESMHKATFFALRHILSFETSARAVSAQVDKVNKTHTVSFDTVLPGHAVAVVALRKGARLPAHRSVCRNWEGAFSAFLEAGTGQRGRIIKRSCCFDGASACTYEMRWQPATRLERAVLPVSLFLAGVGASVPIARVARPHWSAWEGALFGALCMGLAAALLAHRKIRANTHEFLKKFEKFEEDADQKYLELQQSKEILEHRFHEGLLLEETTRMIHTASDVKELTATALRELCTRFGLDRAILFLPDEAHETLEAFDAFGVDLEDSGLASTKLSLSRALPARDVLSSVFLTGKSALILNAGQTLWPHSRRAGDILGALGTKGFVMVAIPGARGSVGIIAADKHRTGENVTRNHQITLERLASVLGAAIEKQQRLNREMAMRSLFQRYAPNAATQNIDESRMPGLGGELRHVHCLFFDVVDFTRRIEGLHPAATVGLMSRVLTMIDGLVVDTQGEFDKFLGDGGLVVWGMGESDDGGNAMRSMLTALGILARLEGFNERLALEGLPSVGLRMGLHAGETVVGNVGSHRRMEFTCMGFAVNVASRLEAFCKETNSPLCVSGKVIDSVSARVPAFARAQGFWEKFANVQLRGASEPIDLFVWRGARAREAQELLESLVPTLRSVS